MIHGLSKHTQGAGGAVKYFLADQYFEQPEPGPDSELDPETGEPVPVPGVWVDREPKPVVLEGDPAQMVALCESLSFKNRYTSAVLSFSPEETAHIAANPGMKDNIIEDLRKFAYAGVEGDDCKPLLVVQHEHTGRLELHYLIPRVSLESGKYFNPYPPNYDGRKGKGANDVYIKQNDTFTDYMCSKYSLQNPRDPTIAREIKISKFDPNKTDKKMIQEAVGKLIDSGGIKSREDIISFLEKAGGTITRKGADYLSVRFDENKKAIRLKGDYYGEQSYSEISSRIERTAERINRPFEEIDSEYAEVLSERAEDVKGRHSLKGLAAERADGFDRKSTDELKSYADELSALKDSLGDNGRHSHGVSSAIANDSTLIHAADNPTIDIGGIAEAMSGAEPILTGDPAIDALIKAFHKMQNKLAQEELQRVKQRYQVDPNQEKMIKQIQDWITKLFSGLALGKNFITGRPGAMAPSDIALARQMITEQRRELQRELRAVAVVVKQRERVEPLLDILDKKEPVFEAKPAPAAPADIAASDGGLQTSTDHIGDLLGMGKGGKKLKPKAADDGTSGTTYG